MKRILPLILTVLLLPALLAVPARADDYNLGGWIQLLDYGFPSGYDSNFINLTPNGSEQSLYLWYNVPGNLALYNFDIIFRTDDTSPGIATYNQWLTVTSLGDGLYRAIGSAGNVGESTFCNFSYDNGTFVEILSFKASSVPFARYAKTYSGYVYDFSYEPVKEVFFSGYGADPMQAVNILPSAASSSLMAGHVVRLDIPNWQSMDYITLNIASWSTIVSSLTVEIAGLPVPYTINTIESGNIQGVSLFLIDVVIDLTNVDHTLGSPISVDLSGQVKLPYQGTFAVQSCLGFVSIDPPSPLAYWFSELGSWISNQTNTVVTYFNYLYGWLGEHTGYITGAIATWGQKIVDAISGTGDSSHIQSGIDSAVDELNQAGAALDAVQRPDIGSIDINVVSGLDPAGLSGFASIVSLFTGNSVIYTIMMMFVTLSLISFILFGKG